MPRKVLFERDDAGKVTDVFDITEESTRGVMPRLPPARCRTFPVFAKTRCCTQKIIFASTVAQSTPTLVSDLFRAWTQSWLPGPTGDFRRSMTKKWKCSSQIHRSPHAAGMS